MELGWEPALFSSKALHPTPPSAIGSIVGSPPLLGLTCHYLPKQQAQCSWSIVNPAMAGLA